VDFLDYQIEDPATQIIALFLESVREPDRFVAALDRAAARGKPVVVLKVAAPSARDARSRATRVVSPANRASSQPCCAPHRAIEVNELDEMVEVLRVLSGSALAHRTPSHRDDGIRWTGGTAPGQGTAAGLTCLR
jgi:acetyltransferase